MENYRANEARKGPTTDAAHVWRYYLARGFIEPGDVVNDVACGWGYGSNILSRSTAERVRGYDYDEGAIKGAHQDFPHIDFRVLDFDTPGATFLPCDYTVAIETIEHVDDPEAFAHAVKLATRRYILVTTPFVPTTQEALGDEGSPYHHHDFSLVTLDNIFIRGDWKKLGDTQIGRHGLVVYYAA